MASTCFIFLSSTLAAWSIAGFTPGNRPSTFLSGPIFCICRMAPRKSSRSSPFFEVTFFASRSASFSSTAPCAFSTSERMSPCWRIRPGQAVGVERLQRVELLAHADVLDRRVGDAVDRERRAAARVAVHLGQDHAGDAEGVVKALGDPDRVLAGHAVGDEQDLVRR